MKKLTLMIAALAFLTVSSCNKDEDDAGTTTPTKSKTELITAKAWKMTALTVSPGITPVPGGPTITDVYSLMDPCEKDDTEKYNTGGSGVSDEGATKCDPADPQTENFTWAFANNETKLVLDGDTGDILQLDGTTLKIATQVDGSELGGTPGTMYTLTITYKNN